MKWPAAMLLLAVSIAPAYAQDTLVQQLYKQPDAVAASAGGVEDVTKCTQNARHFRNSGGAWTAVVATGLNYDDGKGGLLPVLPELWQTSSGGWQMQAGPLSVRSPERRRP